MASSLLTFVLSFLKTIPEIALDRWATFGTFNLFVSHQVA